MTYAKMLKTTLFSFLMLVNQLVSAQSPLFGNKLGIDYLTLEEVPAQNVTVCIPDERRFTPDELSIAVDPFTSGQIRMAFTISEMTATDEDRIVFLVYSTHTSPSPQLPSRGSNVLGIDLPTAEILGVYRVPALRLEKQNPTEVGLANPSPTSKITVNVNFDSSKLADLIRTGNNTIYVQAALIKDSDFREQRFGDMILSEMDTLHFVKLKCPNETDTSYAADESGRLTNARISFVGIKPLYEVGDIIKVDVKTYVETQGPSQRVDLWAVIILPNENVLFRTSSPLSSYSLEPQPYLKSLELENNIYPVHEFEVAAGFGGGYYYYAFFVPENEEFSDIIAKINAASLEAQSNIAVAYVLVSQR
jgi:hypothetical protein